MKKRIFSRILSIVLAIAMVLEFVPTMAIETQAANDLTDLNIQYDYREATGIDNADEEITNEANKGHQSVTNSTSVVWPSNGGIFTDIKDGDFKCKDGGKFRQLLESNDTQYIRLVDDLKATSSHDDYDVINITADKVIDLNGHTIELYDKRNKIDTHGWVTESYDQSTTQSDHMSYIFEIDNGATLTIIDSQGKAYDPNAKAKTGRIYANGCMINHQIWDFLYYTHRDIFLVNNGNLVIHGGEFQAGRQKDQYKSGFSWNKLKEVVGQAVDLGVAIYEYSSGISAAKAAEADLSKYYEDLEKLEEEAKKNEAAQDAGNDGTTKKKDGTGADVAKDKKTDTPASAGNGDDAAQKNQTVAQKQDDKNKNKDDAQNKKGDQSKENKADENKPSKYEKETKLAEKEKAIGDAALDKSKIGAMVDTAFALGEGIYHLLSNDSATRATACIQGTVAQVQNGGTLVVYGGKFIGHGSTPNVRNAVIEVEKTAVKYPSDSVHEGKHLGGMAYIYGGIFEAYTGANVFNMVRGNAQTQKATMRVKDEDGNIKTEEITLAQSETFGQEPLTFENDESWDDWAEGWEKLATDEARANYPQPPRVSTANIMVRGGTFRCYYEICNMAILADKAEGGQKPEGEDDDYDHRKFTGTPGAVNLGVESFGEDLIRDGRIQIVDVYGQGSLVLLDGGEPIGEKSTDNTLEGNTYQTEGGFRHYRLFIGDSELRSLAYIHAYPNEAKTNSTFALNLATYWGNGDEQVELWSSDKGNIRAPYSSNEKFFNYIYDDIQANNAGITPTYYVIPELDDMKHPTDSDLATSNVWYYNTPLDTEGDPIPDISYGALYEVGKNAANQKIYNAVADENYKTNIKWFTYKVYRVDPLTRENINENKKHTGDDPLIEVVYGAKNDSLKCKLDIQDIAAQIRRKRPTWNGFQSGEMYRIEFSVEEKLGTGYQGNGNFINEFDAKATSSILFLCSSKEEQKEESYQDPQTGQWKERYAPDFTPLQFDGKTVAAGEYAEVALKNGWTSMVDYEGAKVFDIYYQWYEVDEDGSNPRLIAGTDNIWVAQEATSAKMNHWPQNWLIKESGMGVNGELYYNTVDPADSNASTYGLNGLPKDHKKWTYDQLHMYTQETVGKHNSLKLEQDKNLSLDNNNREWANTDRCYIPEELVGKYIQVKAVAVNVRYPVIYDNLQTFTSHVIKVAEPNNEFYVKLDRPQAGKTPDYTMEFPADANYKAGQQGVIWNVRDNASSSWKKMAATDTFVAGKQYYAKFEIALNEGEKLPLDERWGSDVYLNGELQPQYSPYEGYSPELGEHEGLDVTSNIMTCNNYLKEVYLEVREPVAGQAPGEWANVPFGASYRTANAQDSSYADLYNDVCWFLVENGRYEIMDPERDEFEAGKVYEVQIVLEACHGAKFDFQSGSGGYIYYTVPYINGVYADEMEVTQLDDEEYFALICHQFTAKENDRKLLVHVNGVDAKESITVQLYKNTSTAPMKTVTVNGNDIVTFDNLDSAKYTVKAFGTGYEDFSQTIPYWDGTQNCNVRMTTGETDTAVNGKIIVMVKPDHIYSATVELYAEDAKTLLQTKTYYKGDSCKFENLPVGTYVVKASKDGYKDDTHTVTISKNANTCQINFLLLEETKEEVCKVFTDVKHGAWYESAVQYVYDEGLMSGNDGLFKPTENVTRAQLVTTLYRLAGNPKVTDYSACRAFSDVKEGKYYTDAVCWAYNVGVATGNNGKFDTTGNLARQQLAAFVFRFAGVMGYDTTAREDYSSMLNADQVSGYAKEGMQWAVGSGLISGSQKTVNGVTVKDLNPKGNTTRVQLAAILQRFCENNGL